MSDLGGHLGLSGALLEPSWAILGAPTPREPPRPGPGEGVGGGVKTPSPPASRLAHSHPPSQHISSTRASACSAVAFGWTATGNQQRPHVRDAGARCATRARRATRARHPWGPSAPGTPSPCQKPLHRDRGVAARGPGLAAKCNLYCCLTGVKALRTAGNMLAPPPSPSKNNSKCSRGSRA